MFTDSNGSEWFTLPKILSFLPYSLKSRYLVMKLLCLQSSPANLNFLPTNFVRKTAKKLCIVRNKTINPWKCNGVLYQDYNGFKIFVKVFHFPENNFCYSFPMKCFQTQEYVLIQWLYLYGIKPTIQKNSTLFYMIKETHNTFIFSIDKSQTTDRAIV